MGNFFSKNKDKTAKVKIFIWEISYKFRNYAHFIIIKDLYGYIMESFESDNGTYLYKFVTNVTHPVQLMRNFYFTISVKKLNGDKMIAIYNSKKRKKSREKLYF
jgi:hypothetical protein